MQWIRRHSVRLLSRQPGLTKPDRLRPERLRRRRTQHRVWRICGAPGRREYTPMQNGRIQRLFAAWRRFKRWTRRRVLRGSDSIYVAKFRTRCDDWSFEAFIAFRTAIFASELACRRKRPSMSARWRQDWGAWRERVTSNRSRKTTFGLGAMMRLTRSTSRYTSKRWDHSGFRWLTAADSSAARWALPILCSIFW